MMAGIYIQRGLTLGFPSITLTWSDDGTISSEPVNLTVHFDVCPTWIRIAKCHLDLAVMAKNNRDQAWLGTDEDAKARTLENEFEASMQAIMAAAIAWDALYGVLQECIKIPAATIEKWRRERDTSRYAQVTEVIRRAFCLKPKGTTILRNYLQQLYRYRDLAVHPSGETTAPVLHPELNLGMEWRFSQFRASNAENAVQGAAALIWDLANNGKSKVKKVSDYRQRLASRLRDIFPEGIPKVAGMKD